MELPDLENPLLSPAPGAWERLIESVDPAALLVVIERRMSARLRAEHAAEDVLQEALLHAWRGRATCEWRGLRSFRAWILTIIDHRLHDLADRASAEKRAGGATFVSLGQREGYGSTTHGGESGLAAGSTTPSRLASYREQAELMMHALDGLPDDVRDVVRARLFEQQSLEEIAAGTGLGLSAVRHRFRKGAELYMFRLRAALSSRAGALESPTAAAARSSPGSEPPPR